MQEKGEKFVPERPEHREERETLLGIDRTLEIVKKGKKITYLNTIPRLLDVHFRSDLFEDIYDNWPDPKKQKLCSLEESEREKLIETCLDKLKDVSEEWKMNRPKKDIFTGEGYDMFRWSGDLHWLNLAGDLKDKRALDYLIPIFKKIPLEEMPLSWAITFQNLIKIDKERAKEPLIFNLNKKTSIPIEELEKKNIDELIALGENELLKTMKSGKPYLLERNEHMEFWGMEVFCQLPNFRKKREEINKWLMGIVGDPKEDLVERLCTTHLLGSNRAKEAFDILVKNLKDEKLRYSCLLTLIKFEDRRSFNVAEKWIKDYWKEFGYGEKESIREDLENIKLSEAKELVAWIENKEKEENKKLYQESKKFSPLEEAVKVIKEAEKVITREKIDKRKIHRLYQGMLSIYRDLMKKVSLESQTARELNLVRERLGREKIVPEFLRVTDKQRDDLHKAMIGLAKKTGLTKDDVYLDIIWGKEKEVLPEGFSIVRSWKRIDKREGIIILGAGGYPGQGGSFMNNLVRFSDLVGKDEYKFNTHFKYTGDYKEILERHQVPFLKFRKYLIDKYKNIFSEYSNFDEDFHDAEITEGVLFKSKDVHKAIAIFREEIEKFRQGSI